MIYPYLYPCVIDDGTQADFYTVYKRPNTLLDVIGPSCLYHIEGGEFKLCKGNGFGFGSESCRMRKCGSIYFENKTIDEKS